MLDHKPDSVFFSDWSRNSTYDLLSSDELSYFKETSGQVGQKLVRNLNGADKVSFCEEEFSHVSVEAPQNFNNHNSLKAERCSGEDVLAVLSVCFKGDGMFQNCLQNENGNIFPCLTLG